MKKQQFNYLGMFLLAFLLTACSRSDDLSLQNNTINVYNYKAIYHHYATLQPQRTTIEAIKIAANFVQSQGIQTRNMDNGNIENWTAQSICSKKKIHTRGTLTESTINPVDTIYYILNNSTTKSFCIVAGDRRISESLLAFSGEGILELDSLNGTENINAFLLRLPNYYEDKLKEARKRRKDTITTLPEFNYEERDRFVNPETYTDKLIVPEPSIDRFYTFINISQTENLCKNNWSCDKPYDRFTPTVNGRKAELSSIMITLAHLVSSFSYPKEYKGTTLDWELLHRYKTAEEATLYNNNYTIQVANLLKNIGDGLWYKYWGPFETTENFDKVIDVLRDMGYSNPSEITKKYSIADVINSIDNHCPVLMYGESKKARNRHISPKAYSWLCDGYKIIERRIKGVTDNIPKEPAIGERYKLLHINWGMGGKYNGYFSPDVFNPTCGSGNETPLEKEEKSKDNKDYNLKVRTILNIHP